jgi:general secretion pathway protein G
MKNRSKLIKDVKAFTLIELMVVVVILGLLAALVAPKVIDKLGKANTNAAYTQIHLLGTALDSFRLDMGRYPTSSEGLEALMSSPSGGDNWSGPYLKKEEIPDDPWGKPYIYQSPGDHGDYDLYSFGADGSEGGDNDNRDIASWKGLK